MTSAEAAESETRPRRRPRWRLLRRALLVVLALVLLPYALVPLYSVVNPSSTPMMWRKLTGAPVEHGWVPIDQIAPILVRSVLASEDTRFCDHSGIDFEELQAAIGDAEELADLRGGSTITQQTAKNLFLWGGRSFIRKGLEAPLALWMELVLSKERILEIYLNIAQWGPGGQFGAEAGARYAFDRPAGRLSAGRGGADGGDPAQSGPPQRQSSPGRGCAGSRRACSPGPPATGRSMPASDRRDPASGPPPQAARSWPRGRMTMSESAP